MKKIIVLRGVANVGKTTTLVKLFLRLIQHKCSIEVEIFKPVRDIQVTVTAGNVKIGIGSSGDVAEQVKANLNIFAQSNCDIVFCATRTRGGTVDAVEEFARQQQREITWEPKEPCPQGQDPDLADSKTIEKLLSLADL